MGVEIRNSQKKKTSYLSLFVYRNICIEIIFITICYKYIHVLKSLLRHIRIIFLILHEKNKKKRKFVHLLVSFIRRKFSFVILKRILYLRASFFFIVNIGFVLECCQRDLTWILIYYYLYRLFFYQEIFTKNLIEVATVLQRR